MQEHYNHSIGQFVTNKQQFYDGLKRQGEIASLHSGLDTDYQPIDPTDMKDPSSHGVTEEGLEETFRSQRND